MLSKDKLKKISFEECTAMLGKELVTKHIELCCASYGLLANGMFHYCLGLDTKEREWQFGDESPMEFYASVVVNPEDGRIIRDYENSTLPN